MKGRSCVVVLVGFETANRKWGDYEIKEGWNNKKGIVGIHIHGLKDKDSSTSKKGENPFDNFSPNGKKLSTIAKCYNSQGSTSKERYSWIKDNLSNIVEEAIDIRNNH